MRLSCYDTGQTRIGAWGLEIPADEPLIYLDADERRIRLLDLLLVEKDLREAVEDALGLVLDCNENDAPTAAGFILWDKTTRYVRERLKKQGWAVSNAGNFCLTIAPHGRHALVVAGGNDNTGTKLTPTTITPKGPRMLGVVEHNQMGFAEVDPDTWSKAGETAAPRWTWILLLRIDHKREQIRMELSLPDGLNHEQYVSRWRERIILDPIPLTPGLPPFEMEDDGGAEVQVERKSG